MSEIVNRIRPGDGDSRHGLTSSYTNHGCRCEQCRAAWAEYCRNRRQERSLPTDDPRHGKDSTYQNYGCRCRQCSEAHAAYRRKQYLATRAVAA
jgi:hypothetical protein